MMTNPPSPSDVLATPEFEPAAEPAAEPTTEPAAYRSGAAARLAGIPVETLRVWERRHGVTAPQRSLHGQRLYSLEEIRRLSLIKQLVDHGNQIGAIAQLPDEQLSSMLGVARTQLPGAVAVAEVQAPIRVALVGQTLGLRLIDCRRHAIDIVANCSGVSGAAKALRAIVADVVVIELGEMTQPSLAFISGIKDAAGASGVVVLYRFCSSSTIRQLREAGHVVAHAPSDAAEIALLCHSAMAHRAPRATPLALPGAIPARRFDDLALAQLALMNSSVSCECPRHLAEILLTLVSFERYSAQCENSSPADAVLHRHLQHSAAQARALLENALEELVRSEGLHLT
jgi:DNA-binding transcriptional MerR regulator